MEKSKERVDAQKEGAHQEHLQKKTDESSQAGKEHLQKKTDESSQAEKISELTDTLQRLQAEFENYKKYIAKQQKDFFCYAKAETIAKILPILDSFERSFKHRDEPREFSKGMELIFHQLATALQNEGLRKIETVGKKVDPFQHEVLLAVEDGRPEGTIIEELQAGYFLGDKVLRHAKVKISRPKQQPAEKTEEGAAGNDNKNKVFV
ncbi:nucleotide exchange factor GrpE [Candidatus Woesearchaeota archaeon]|nr:nucleotide exchange factor GrpE [Candidatus Woesearchaeota archaeon]